MTLATEDPRLELLLEAVRRGYPQEMVAQGRSMLPSIAPGARVRLLPMTEAPTMGTVVAAFVGNTFCIHRVVGVRRGPRWLLKGDNNPGPDGWIGRGDIVARVELAAP